MNGWGKVAAVLIVPVAVIAAVVLFELLRVALSRRRRAAILRQVQDRGVTATVVALLKTPERERPMGTTTSAGPVVHVEFNMRGLDWMRDATAHVAEAGSKTGTATAGRQPANATRYVGAVTAVARPVAAEA